MPHASSTLLERDAVIHACGEDLEYDASFLSLQHAALGKREQQFGTTIIPAEAPDWRQVEKLAIGLGERTLDIRVLVYQAQACAEQYGLARYAEVLQTLAQAVDEHWDDIHPRLDMDGDHDPLPRMNALSALGDPAGAARSVRDAVLIKNEYGVARLRDVEAVLDTARGQAAIDYPGGRTRLVEDLQSAYVLNEPAVTALPTARDALTRIKQTVIQHLGDAWTPDVAALQRSLDTVVHALALSTPAHDDTRPVAEPAVEVSRAASGLPDVAKAGGAPPAAMVDAAGALRQVDAWRDAEIVSRADATAMLEKVCRYFEVNEPSHPAPMLIRRIQQLIPLGFYDIIKNLAPQGLGDVETFMPRHPPPDT
ncbi:MAG: type VI secretion system protein TssA [Burkholderiaceae bacterium]